MIASRIFVKLKSKVESKSISCRILPASCLVVMSKKPKYLCKFQKEWSAEFDFVQASRLGVNNVYCSFCNTDFRVATVTVFSAALAAGGKHYYDVTRHKMGKTHLPHKKIVAQSHPLRGLFPLEDDIEDQVIE